MEKSDNESEDNCIYYLFYLKKKYEKNNNLNKIIVEGEFIVEEEEDELGSNEQEGQTKRVSKVFEEKNIEVSK
jgi:hypothetical protein